MKKGPIKKAREPVNSSLLKSPGHLFIISAPSGAGKSTLCHAMLDHFSDLLYSISHTTRPPRKGEQNGVDYYFIPKDEFEKGISHHQWAEWAEVHGNYYGTSAKFLDNGLSAKRDILLDIDVQGTRQILERYPDGITIFVLPPSLEVLKQRLEARGTDSPEVVAVRLDNARKEMAQKNMYRHIVTNDRLPDATAEMVTIFESYRS
jgi:guanylate kinase